MRAIVLSQLPDGFGEADVRELLAPYGGAGTVVQAPMPDGGRVFAAALLDPTKQEQAVRELNGRALGRLTLRVRPLPAAEAYTVFMLSPGAGK
jgi:hypothetical protein